MEEKIVCPYCGSTAQSKHGRTRIGTQRYLCKYCGKKHAGERSMIKFDSFSHNVICKFCGSANIKLAGYSHGNKEIRRYYCRDCKRKFTTNTKPRKTSVILSDSDRKLIIMYTQNLRISPKEVAKHINKPYWKVLKYIKEYKKLTK